MSIPSAVKLHRRSAILELQYGDGEQYQLPAELLRVYSPSAEVRGHGKGQAVLQTGKRDVGLLKVEPIGHYAIKLTFDDGHDSGIYSWDYLYQLCLEKDTRWQSYLNDLANAGASRDPNERNAALSDSVQVINIQPLSKPKS